MDPIRPWLYIGKYRETVNQRLLSVNGIQAMLLLEELVQQPGITSLYLSVRDFAPIPPYLLRQGVDFVREEKAQGHRVLSACGAGINRSSAFAIAVLREEEGLSLLEAFRAVKRRHAESMPHLPVWESLCSYYHEDTPFIRLMSSADKEAPF